jgi:hypothetical protein
VPSPGREFHQDARLAAAREVQQGGRGQGNPGMAANTRRVVDDYAGLQRGAQTLKGETR